MYQDRVMEMRYAAGVSSPPVVGGIETMWIGGVVEGVDIDSLLDHILDLDETQPVDGGAECGMCDLFIDTVAPPPVSAERITAPQLRALLAERFSAIHVI